MTSLSKRLFSLNLALLLTALLAVPAAAQESLTAEDLQTDMLSAAATSFEEPREEKHLSQADHDPHGELLQDLLSQLPPAPQPEAEDEALPPEEDGSGLPPEEEEDEVSLLAQTPVIILDQGVHVYPGRDANGYGWYYDDSANELTLDEDYSGGSISIYSGLTLWIEDDVTISATDGSTFGYHAIVHDPIAGTSQYSSSLVISGQPNASLTVNGGDGDYGGGSAIYSSGHVYCSVDAVLTGGNSTYSYDPYNDTHAIAGDGIWAQGISLVGQNISAYGGDVLTISNAMEGYGGYGLYASGSISVYGSNHTAVGGDAAYFGGYGTRAPSVSITAENCSFTGGTGSTYGGAGILGGTSVSLSKGSISVTGGDADVHGGYGILTPKATIRADCTLQGGYGYTSPAPGLFYESTCVFGANNITMINGGDEIAFQRAVGSSNPSTSPHTNTYGYGTNYSTIQIRLKDYWLDLYANSASGRGWNFEGESTFSTLQPYGTTYDLADYIFESSRYTQVGWGDRYNTAGKNILPLNTVVRPTTSTSLYAVWTSVTPENLIVLNGMEGMITTSERYTTTVGESVELPDSLRYSGGKSLLGWSSEVVPEADESGTLSGVWYEGGDTVYSNPCSATLLYGQSDTGVYAVYHPNGGTFTNGGSILVQGTRSTDSDLTVYAPTADVITAPEGLMLAGWAASPTAATPKYESGKGIPLDSNDDPIHLYAVWKPGEFTTEVNGMTVTHIPATGTVTVTVPLRTPRVGELLAAGIYREDGQLISFAMTPVRSATFSLTATYTGAASEVRLFLLEGDRSPAAAHETVSLTERS